LRFFRGERRAGLARGWGFGAHRDLDRVAAKDLAEKRETIAHGRLGPVETARVWPLPLAAHPRGKTARSVLGYERVPILPALAARSRREGTPIESHATRVARGSKVTNLRPPHFVTPRALEGEWRQPRARIVSSFGAWLETGPPCRTIRTCWRIGICYEYVSFQVSPHPGRAISLTCAPRTRASARRHPPSPPSPRSPRPSLAPTRAAPSPTTWAALPRGQTRRNLSRFCPTCPWGP